MDLLVRSCPSSENPLDTEDKIDLGSSFHLQNHLGVKGKRMKLTKTQKEILTGTTATSKLTVAQIGLKIGIPAGPAGRSVKSLVGHGLMKSATNKKGDEVFSRTAEGSKAAKKID